MGLETGTWISDLVDTNPLGSDPTSQGDDHLRLIKKVVQDTLPNASKAFDLNVIEQTADDALALATAASDIAGRNLLMNSNFQVWQRILNSPNAPDGYIADRWYYTRTGGTPQVLKAAGTAGISGSVWKMVPAVGNTGVTVAQRIESVAATTVVGQDVTLSAYFRSTVAISVIGTLEAADGVDNWTTQTSLEATAMGAALTPNVWERREVTWSAVDAQAANGVAPALFVSPLDTATLEIANVQFEIAGSASTYEYQSPAAITDDCLRYFERVNASDSVGLFTPFGAGAHIGVGTGAYIAPCVSKRAPPVLTTSAVSGLALTTSDGSQITCTGITPDTRSRNSVYLLATVATGLTGGDGSSLIANSNNTAWVAFDAEL